MAKDRIQVPDLYKDRSALPQIATTARPVDTFVSPNHPVQDHRLLELATAFQEIQPGLSRFADQRIAHSNEIDVEAGTKAALENKQQFKKAVDEGAIPPGANPWFKAGYEKQKARIAANDYDRELKEAYALSGLSDQDDPKKFDGWVADFTANWQEMHPDHKDNPEFPQVFTAAAAKSQDNLATEHAVARTHKIEADVIQNTERELSDVLGDQESLLGGDGSQIGQRLADVVNVQVANGLNGQVANKLVAQAVVRQAIANEDISVLDRLNDVPSGSGTVGQIGYVKDMVTEARHAISAAKMSGDHLANLAHKAEREKRINTIRGQAYLKIAADPHADTSEEFKALNAEDPDEAAKVEAFRTSFIGSLTAQNKVIESNPLKTKLLLLGIKGQLTEEQVAMSVDNGEIDYDTAKDLLTVHIPKAKEHKSVLNDPIVNKFSKDLGDTITKNQLADEFADQRTFRASEAQAAYLSGMIQYKEMKPQATQLESLKYSQDLKNTLLEIYREDNAEPLPTVNLDKVDPTKQSLFNDIKSFDTLITEYNATQGKSGKIAGMAAQYGMDPKSFIAAQRALIPKPVTPPPKK